MPKLFFDFALIDEYGTIHGKRRIQVSEDCAYMGSRIKEDLNMGVELGITDFTSIVEILKIKEFRKQILIQAAANCGMALAEQLEDREGWHGLDRQDRVEESLK